MFLCSQHHVEFSHTRSSHIVKSDNLRGSVRSVLSIILSNICTHDFCQFYYHHFNRNVLFYQYLRSMKIKIRHSVLLALRETLLWCLLLTRRLINVLLNKGSDSVIQSEWKLIVTLGYFLCRWFNGKYESGASELFDEMKHRWKNLLKNNLQYNWKKWKVTMATIVELFILII